MSVSEWQNRFSEEIAKTYPKHLSKEQRLLAVFRQVSDVSRIMAKEDGVIRDDGTEHKGSKQAIADVFIDLFVLAEMQGVDLEKEFEGAIAFFQKKRKG